jgi:hypothetical protein
MVEIILKKLKLFFLKRLKSLPIIHFESILFLKRITVSVEQILHICIVPYFILLIDSFQIKNLILFTFSKVTEDHFLFSKKLIIYEFKIDFFFL